jgi:hypothetical protein
MFVSPAYSFLWKLFVAILAPMLVLRSWRAEPCHTSWGVGIIIVSCACSIAGLPLASSISASILVVWSGPSTGRSLEGERTTGFVAVSATLVWYYHTVFFVTLIVYQGFYYSILGLIIFI